MRDKASDGILKLKSPTDTAPEEDDAEGGDEDEEEEEEEGLP